DLTKYGRINPEVFPSQDIKTVPHSAWQSKGIPIPKPLVAKVIEMLRDRLRRGVLKESHASYRNNWFLVKKKD
ncbi:hypothetical protein B0T24DRAFT_486358, partial [Lasiosphaeria ovina]